ncbi:helix-turn-helix domain-containing protein [candidate division KSB3 bacterium]|uniref:Helix-turn-helix domain-containing protein n=1 Tax=candidate division KSB3 bacterium TaxID=2044937 RepID=A0A9D5Q718_9BACT|nr:helix-turn-helix domain-containing protein [candidate division KSB3 bacterium]MBD3325963.1 helix-turn-helix domain-containing protein [candidate division KSB3 bacterium]
MYPPNQLNKIIHERVRLAIMSALVTREGLTFPELKAMLQVTDGNLSVHASILEKHGLIRMEKDFNGKKPRTTFFLTKEGRRQFQQYIADLEQLLAQAKDL